MVEPGEALRPDVILDVVFEDGLLFLSLANTGARPATNVTCRFDRPLHGLGGRVDVSRLRLFRAVGFLPAGKEIRTLVDESAAYFARREPTKLTVELTWRDEEGRRYERRIVHDLGIYKDLAYVPARGATLARWPTTKD